MRQPQKLKAQLSILQYQRAWALTVRDYPLAMYCSQEIQRIRKLIKQAQK